MEQRDDHFVNPTSDWAYNGTFSVELKSVFTIDTSILGLNTTTKVDKLTITFINAEVKSTFGGISVQDSLKHRFKLVYKHIACVRKENGEFLWKNSQCQTI